MDLIYGIIIGMQLAFSFGLAFVVYLLWNKSFLTNDRIALAEVETKTNRTLIKRIDQTVLDLTGKSNENFTNASALAKDFDRRLKLLEAVEVPEHLTFTQEQTIKKEVKERLAKTNKVRDINFLDNVRDEELADYNQEFNPGVN